MDHERVEHRLVLITNDIRGTQIQFHTLAPAAVPHLHSLAPYARTGVPAGASVRSISAKRPVKGDEGGNFILSLLELSNELNPPNKGYRTPYRCKGGGVPH